MLRLTVDVDAPEGEAVNRAAHAIRAGELVAFPTETVYGLGADALNPAAVEGIFRAKERPADNPLIVHVADVDQLEEVAQGISATARALAARFWPGPLTLVLRRLPHIPDVTTGGLDTVAVRIPDHPVALALLRASGRPIAAPSANRSGRPSPTRAEHVLDDLHGRAALILDAGPCPVGVESTVLDLSDGSPTLLRAGGVATEAIEAVVGPLRRADSSALATARRSPGTRYRHYAPRATLVLAPPGEAESVASRLRAQGERVGILSRSPVRSGHGGSLTHAIPGPVESYAQGLFAGLRELDRQGCSVIVAESVEEHGIGLAIMDRLRRAASASGE